MHKESRAKPVCPRPLGPSFRSISLIIIEKQFKVCLTNARRRRAEERGILKGERIAKNSAGRSLFNHQPFCRVLKHLSPLSGASLVRFLPTGARNEHLLEFLWLLSCCRWQESDIPRVYCRRGQEMNILGYYPEQKSPAEWRDFCKVILIIILRRRPWEVRIFPYSFCSLPYIPRRPP